MGKPSEILSRLTDGATASRFRWAAGRCSPCGVSCCDHAGRHSAGAAGPCGMNCQVCYRHLTPRRACLGCRGGASNKPPHCRDCALKACAAERGVAFCAACPRFPCKSIAALEKTYQKRWGISLAETGRRAAAGEAEALLAGQRRRWLCTCGGVISLHDGVCSECGRPVD